MPKRVRYVQLTKPAKVPENGPTGEEWAVIRDGAVITTGTAKVTPANNDKLVILDSAAGGAVKEITLAQLILNYLDSRYYAASAVDALIAGLAGSLDGRKPLAPMVAGGYYDTMSHGLGRGGAPTGANLSANTLYLTPFDLPADVTISEMQINVTTLASSGKARVGWFDYSRTTNVATRLADFGEQDTDTTGIKTFSGSVALTKGRRWLGVLMNATTGVTIHFPAQSLYFINFTAGGAGYSKAVTYGAFDASYSTFSAGLNAVPLVAVRVQP